mgnify:CR=1 FL=1
MYYLYEIKTRENTQKRYIDYNLPYSPKEIPLLFLNTQLKYGTLLNPS